MVSVAVWHISRTHPRTQKCIMVCITSHKCEEFLNTWRGTRQTSKCFCFHYRYWKIISTCFLLSRLWNIHNYKESRKTRQFRTFHFLSSGFSRIRFSLINFLVFAINLWNYLLTLHKQVNSTHMRQFSVWSRETYLVWNWNMNFGCWTKGRRIYCGILKNRNNCTQDTYHHYLFSQNLLLLFSNVECNN